MNLVRLEDVFSKIRNGKSIKQTSGASGYPITRIETIAKEVIDKNKLGYADIKIIEPYKDYLLEDGDILFSHINSIPHLGKCALFFNSKQKIIHGMNLLCFKPDKQKIFPKFALYTLRSSYFKTKLPKITNKSVNQASISVGNLKKLQIPLPPLAEQKRIAGILDKADEIRKKRQQAIKECDEFLKATFLDMFGDPVNNPKGWEEKELKEFGNISTGNTPPRKHKEYYGNYIEWIKSDNVNTPNMYLTTATEYLSEKGIKYGRVVPPKSILVTCIAGSKSCIGNTAITDRDVCFNQQINAITPSDNENSLFLYSLFVHGKKLIQTASSNGMKGIVSKSNFSKIRFISPPLPLQEKFAKIVEKTEAMKTRMQESATELDNNFNNLMQRAFKGEL